MGTATSDSRDLTLVLREHLSDSYELSQVLLASASYDGRLQLLTSGWERVLGYGRKELRGKSLLQLTGCRRTIAAILDTLDLAPVELRMRCRSGLSKAFRLHRHYDQQEHVMYVVADEVVGAEA
jgi:PAS domain-containing protein